jgi:hypothetical protein
VANIGPVANAKQNKKNLKLRSPPAGGWFNAAHDRGATTDVNRFAKRADADQRDRSLTAYSTEAQGKPVQRGFRD